MAAPRDTIEMTIDWGTGHSTIAYAMFRDGVRVSDPTTVMIEDAGFEEPAMATWLDDGTFVHGHALQAIANDDADVSDRIITLFKLPLSNRPGAREVTARVQDVLEELGKEYEQLLEDHLRAVVSDGKKHIKIMERNRGAHVLTVQQLDEMLNELRVRITVPDSWTPNARYRMQSAASNSGLRHVVLASESKAVIAYLVDKAAHEIVNPLIAAFRQGDIIITADIGCGTADCVANQLEDDISLDCRFRTLGHSSGDICGSAQVDRVLREWLLSIKAKGWATRAAKRLGVTPRDFVRRTLAALAKVKEEFKTTDLSRVCIIPGMDSKYESFSVPREEMLKAMDHVISAVIVLINGQIKPDQFPHAIIVTGGFSGSGYAMKRLKAEYELRGINVIRPSDTDQTACFPVAKGALLRYNNIIDQHLPERYGYAILQRQIFDRANPAHADSWTEDEMVGGEVEYMPWVERSPIDPNVDVVDDRIRTIIAQGEMMANEVRHINMHFHIPVERPHITAEFVCLGKRFADSAASQRRLLPNEGSAEEYTMHDEVHKWRDVDMELPQEQLDAHHFDQVTAGDGEICYKLNVVVVIRKSASGMEIEFNVLVPHQEARMKVEDESDEAVFRGEVAFTVKDASVWDGKHSPFTED
ncbi:unnamed protein product [Zymoseptoria tritici ST99CH_1A5]|uniref:Uncharacterized protein n=1 Tax=Zymoseptoria tritici ST99CH_1A5 TaxID=1276529 RepID=A0A1Y6LB20_ZYMTR|nr:unnamed protein product [Zymoseptoria tritici ST99CH_1A5]